MRIRSIILASLGVLVGSFTELRADSTLAKLVDPGEESFNFSELNLYRAKVKAALSAVPPVLLPEKSTPESKQAIDSALASPEFLKFAVDPLSKSPCRNEIFTVRAVGLNDLGAERLHCLDGRCYRVEMYNFTKNLTTVALVSLSKNSLVSLKHNFDLQPEIPEHLNKIALGIAANSKAVSSALGKVPATEAFLMSSTKTALNATRCERSGHLCVAPTYVQGKEALWSIVDLTDERVVGLRWTAWDDQPFTAGQLTDHIITKELCDNSVEREQDGWRFTFGLTGSDGMVVRDVGFRGEKVLLSAKNVDWHVSYSGMDGFGYSDAVGCPLFSTAAVIPSELYKISSIDTKGFEVVQSFKSKRWPLPCNYSYEQRFAFFKDGSFRIVVGNLGRGCGANGTYRPVIRIALPFGRFEEWDGNQWRRWEKEDWRLAGEGTLLTEEGYQYRISDSSGRGYYLEPGRGQFDDGGRGDNAFVYATRRDPSLDEGEGDLLTIGPCCNSDFAQGPERFLNGESLDGDDLVLWYVPKMQNQGTPGKEYCWANVYVKDGKEVVEQFPCYAGPKFIPIKR